MSGANDPEPPVGTPEWADWWEAKYGRENLDEATRRNLDEIRAPRPPMGPARTDEKRHA